ncbi:uncharacterized protein B0T15DRAFT_545325 [Chaetomium strumarium]|uniref:GRF-type domain-containing protein n=1 Tax=Chaetomium strumarium TaxID=1170767 RepID=A0AAJ0M578_9PEZI|nr:hypothetical protein B0T15DRAFT_545325 [Chaetomium strumarium]
MASPVHTSPSQSGRELGKYENGKWYCCCNLEAAFYTVKKEGSNKGRRFHRCPKWDDQQCRFYLFEDDAKNSPSTRSPNSVPNSRVQVKRNSLIQAIRNRRARRDLPDSEGASTITEGPIYSPASSRFHTPASHRSFLRTPHLSEPDWGSEEDEGTSGTADGWRQPSRNRYADLPTPTPKRKRPETEGTNAGADAGGPAGDAEFSQIDVDEEELAEMAGEAANQGRPAAPAQPPRPSQGSDFRVTPSRIGMRAASGGLQTPSSRSNVTNPASGNNGLNPGSGNSFTSLVSGTTAVEASQPGSKRRRTTQRFAISTPTASRSSSQGDAETTTTIMDLLKVGERISPLLREKVLECHRRVQNKRLQTIEAQLRFALDAAEEKEVQNARLVREIAMQRMEISGLKDELQALFGLVAARYQNDQNDDDIGH